MQKQSKFQAFAQSAANFERFGAYREAAQHWRKAEEKAKKEANKKWCQLRAEFCGKRAKPKTIGKEEANAQTDTNYEGNRSNARI